MKRSIVIRGLIATAAALLLMTGAYSGNYDIEYLLILQDFRNSINNALTPFMEWVSHFAVNYLIYIPVFLYWVIDKTNSLYMFAAMHVSLAVNAALKLTACVYRPWIRDPRVLPAGNAIVEATGYSFPSGHTMCSVPLYGGMIVSYAKKYRWAGILCTVMILLTVFSRNYLGVHTPQDVVIGVLVSVWVLYLLHYLFLYLQQYPEKENRWLLAGALLGIAVVIYITIKPYPMDYVDGKLLVDPKKMQIDAYKDSGMLTVFCAARYIEKTWVRFTPTGFNQKGILLAVPGMLAAFLILRFLQPPLMAVLGGPVGKMAAHAVFVLFIIAGWPMVIRLVCSQQKNDSNEKDD